MNHPENQPEPIGDPLPAQSLERYDLTGRKIANWRVPIRKKLLDALSLIRRIGSKKLPGTAERVEDKLKTAPGKAVEFIEERAKKDAIENRLKIAQTQTEYLRQETEKLQQQLLLEKIRETRAKAFGQELENEKRRIEAIERIGEITRGKPPLQIIGAGDNAAVVFGYLSNGFPEVGTEFLDLASATDEASAGFLASKNSLVFHRPDCKSVASISARSVVRYGSRDEASQAGKRPCAECNP